jgi:superfamily II DNA or RNA helicase
MSALLKLRPYQTEAIAALHERWDAGLHRLAVVLPTGAGKTVVFTHLAEQFMANNPGKRVLVLAHTDELVQQAYKKIKDVAPHRSVGIVKAERNEVTSRVIVASVQSLRSAKRRNQIRSVGLVICDEVHHGTAATYRAIFDHYGCMDGRALLAGFTATLARDDRSSLSDIIQEVAFQRGITWAIRRGYLLDVRGVGVRVPDMDLSRVKKSGGDYADGSLAEEMERSLAPQAVAEAFMKHAGERKAIAFWPTVAVAEHAAEVFAEAGITSEAIHAGLDRTTRRGMLKRLNSGETQVIHGVGVLMEGFDDPTVSCVIWGRPTKSRVVYRQGIGRGLRPDLSLPADQRGDCLVLDVVGASGRHDLRTLVDLSERAPADVEMEDGESLLELEDALDALEEGEQAGSQDPGTEEYYGETVTQDFDPLNRTGIGAWLQTDGGTYFLPAGEVYVLIAPGQEVNTWDVAWLAQKANAPVNGSMGDLTEHQGLSLEMACSWAEEVVEDFGGRVLADRRQTWRRKEPSAPQAAWCERRGVDIQGKTKGEVSDLMSMVFASQRIDPIIGMLAVSR